MAPGTQGPQPSVCEMPQSSGILMLDHTRVSWHSHWVDDLRRPLVLFKDLFGALASRCAFKDPDAFDLRRVGVKLVFLLRPWGSHISSCELCVHGLK